MPKIRVLVVDDSVVIRKLLTDIINEDPECEVVGTASNGQIAVAKMTQLQPDVVTLDVEMPVLDGIETLRALRDQKLTKPTIMFSTLTERGAAATLDAMQLGAADYVTKPSNTGSFDQAKERVRQELLPKIRALGRRAVPKTLRKAAPPLPAGGRSFLDLLAVGCSTGGPNALATFLPEFPDTFPAPIVITQHMPPVFTGLLAKRLDSICELHVVEAEHGMVLAPGTAYIAPGDFHMVLKPRGEHVVLHLNQDPPENSCRPAVDPMMRSVAQVYGRRALAVVLTGMGQDGLVGAQWLKEAGGQVFVQDAASSVVWGMPGAIADAGLADAVLPIEDLPDAVKARFRNRTPLREGAS